jgi:alpha-beta hydrolase superfamily lysophospholipase
MGERDGDKRLVDDMHILTKIMKKRNPDIPYFLFGHSMGSFCARIYSVLFGYELDGVILCGTGDLPSIINAAVDGIDMLVAKYGTTRRIDGMGDIMNKGFSMISEDKGNPLAWLSENAENRLAYSNDEFCGFTYTLAGYRDIYNIMREACDSDWVFRIPKELPIMIISGANDPVGMNGKGVLAIADSLVSAGIEPTTILYPGMRHEITNETDRDVVFKDVLKFLLSLYTKEV